MLRKLLAKSDNALSFWTAARTKKSTYPIVIGSRGEVTINPRELMSRRASIRAFTLWAITATEEADIHAGLIAGLENGTLRPVVGKVLPLAEAARAHKEILEPGSAGKIVLTI